jgi:peptidoglycan/LPS O-acetylase OafA/YrhL
LTNYPHLFRLGGVPLSEVTDGRENNFDLIRIVAAACVLISHSYPLALGAGAVEPLTEWIGHSLGHVSVGVFFAISGFLITRSFDRRSNVRHFAIARVFRIFPALIVVLLITLMLLGGGVTVLKTEQYFLNFDTWTYFVRNLSLFKLQYPLPGVFEDNPYGPAINGSLWTLKHEVLCYAGVLVVGVAGLFRRKAIFATALALYFVFFLGFDLVRDQVVNPLFVNEFRRISIYFVVGSALYIFRHRVPLDPKIVVTLALVLTFLFRTSVFDVLFAVFVSYSTLWVAYTAPKVSEFYRRRGDFSYGLYIYAFPVQQLTAHFVSGITPSLLMLISLPTAMLFAVASWHFVERPSLELSKKLTRKNGSTDYL